MQKFVREQNESDRGAKTKQIRPQHEEAHLPTAILHPNQYGAAFLHVYPSGELSEMRCYLLLIFLGSAIFAGTTNSVEQLCG